MALNENLLKAGLKQAFLANLDNPTQEQIDQITTMAGHMASTIHAFVQAGVIVYNAATLVAPSGGGPVTDTGVPIATLH